jgi:hypothetical protein
MTVVSEDAYMRSLVVAAFLAVAALSTASAGTSDEDAAQAQVDALFAAVKKGDRDALAAMNERPAPKSGDESRPSLEPWPADAAWTTVHRHVEDEWGFFWLTFRNAPGRTASILLMHRVDGAWKYVAMDFAYAEIDLVFHGRPKPAPRWLYRDYLDWTVDSWRKDPRVRPIELDAPTTPVEVEPGRNAAFLLDLKQIVTLRVTATSESDITPAVRIISPAGGSYGSTDSARSAAAKCGQKTSGPILLVVGAEAAGKVVVRATAVPPPIRLALNAAAGPVRLHPADVAEFEVFGAEAVPTKFTFVVVPLGRPAGSFRLTTVTTRDGAGGPGLSTTAYVTGSTVFPVEFSGEKDVEVLAVAVTPTGTPDISADRPAELDLEPGKPRFVRLAPADATAEIVLNGAGTDTGTSFERVSIGDGDRRVAGFVVFSRTATHVRVALLKR